MYCLCIRVIHAMRNLCNHVCISRFNQINRFVFNWMASAKSHALSNSSMFVLINIDASTHCNYELISHTKPFVGNHPWCGEFCPNELLWHSELMPNVRIALSLRLASRCTISARVWNGKYLPWRGRPAPASGESRPRGTITNRLSRALSWRWSRSVHGRGSRR